MTVPSRPIASGYGSINLTGSSTLGLSSAGDQRMILKVWVIATAANASSIIDSTGTTPSAANTILTIPSNTTVGTIYELNYPCSAGIGVVAGTNVTLGVTWE